MTTPSPYIFDEFFASGREESISPFLTPDSKRWGKNLSLKVAVAALVLLLSSFAAALFHPNLSHLLLLFVYFLAGTPAFIGSIEDIRDLEINIDVLMTLAAILSVFIGSGYEGALLLVLFELSGAMENMVSDKTKGTLSQLNQISPRFACVIGKDGALYEKSVKEISVGTTLLIKAGEIVPLDGIVRKGSSFVNLFHLTGESHPVPKTVGDEAQAGALNLDGALTIEVTRTTRDSTLTRIVQLITQAQEAKPQLQRFLDRFGKWYALTIMSLSFLFAMILPWILDIPYLGTEGGVYRALAFLIAASPCALIIATPTAYLSAISSCARRGILLKGGVILDALASCKRIAFDKTGTLTTGKLSCIGIERLGSPDPSCDADTALSIASALERNSVHPIAHAIVSFASEKKIAPIELLSFQSVSGYGLEGIALLGGKETTVWIGHAEFIRAKIPPAMQAEWEKLEASMRKEGHLSTLLLIDKSLFIFHFIDTVRPESIAVIERLRRNENLIPTMLTGDHKDIAEAVAKKVGIEEVFANLRPEDKLAKVSQFSEKEGLIMVGDGINDAPALARSTVGISMGKIGSATAIDASDVVFLNDDLSLLDWLMGKSRQTMRIVRQNLALALSVIFLATTPALLGIVPLWVAVILHEGGTVLVGLNSLRLLRR
ncbi:MAG: cation-translocating P-type ATPase [Chlamydiota bacterium]